MDATFPWQRIADLGYADHVHPPVIFALEAIFDQLQRVIDSIDALTKVVEKPAAHVVVLDR